MSKPVDTIVTRNQARYPAAPSWKEIEKVVRHTRMSYHHFERFYAIPFHHLTQVKRGQRKLSRAYWHIIYEYGKHRKKEKTVPKEVPTPPVPRALPVHPRLLLLE